MGLRRAFGLLLSLLFAAHAWAQISGGLAGRVTDPSGAAVRGAQVTLTRMSTGVKRTTESTADGYYTFTQVLPGSYSVEVAAPGFARVLRQGITVATGATPRTGPTSPANCRGWTNPPPGHRAAGPAALAVTVPVIFEPATFVRVTCAPVTCAPAARRRWPRRSGRANRASAVPEAVRVDPDRADRVCLRADRHRWAAPGRAAPSRSEH